MKTKILFLSLLSIFLIGCKGEDRNNADKDINVKSDSSVSDMELSIDSILGSGSVELNLEEANKLAALPFACINTEYPNKLGQTLGGKNDLKSPKELHPAFYGCFDWHSAVHAQWTLVKLLKQFPKLDNAAEIKLKLEESLSKENIAAEVAYFKLEHNNDFERTYGWAWLLKLSQELQTWDSDLGQELAANLKPLSDLMVANFSEFLPKLLYPIRVGEHTNTAFALSFAYDYAKATENTDLLALIDRRAKEFYLKDDDCPLTWEPSGFDFLSPCLQEVDIMRKVLPKAAFPLWIDDFMPQLLNKDFDMEVGQVSDRTDGKLVHLDGLNFSRAWVLYGLANAYPDRYAHLRTIANNHVAASFPNLVGDSYEGGHWLGSFALYALQEAKLQK